MRAILVDRDGVINRDSPDFIRTPGEWHALPGSLEALARAQAAGWRLVVVSNQSGLARGHFGIAELNAIHRKLAAELARHGARIDAFFFCPHGPDEQCACRKPRAGLLEDIAARLGIDLAETPFIGDRASDAEAALAAGARAVLVRSGLDQPDVAGLVAAGRIAVYDDLAQAIDALL